MMMQKLQRWFGFTGWIWLPVIVCILGIGMMYIVIDVRRENFFKPMSEQLGIENWDDFHNYMAETFIAGMPREEVHKKLSEFGDYRVVTEWVDENEVCELVGLPTGDPVSFTDLQYLFCFSPKDEILTDWAPDPFE